MVLVKFKSTIIKFLKISSGKFFKNTSWLLFEHIFRMILSLLITSLVARFLGTSNFGLLNYGLAYVAIFTVFSKLGLDSILVNEIINNRDKSGEVIGTSIFLRIISSIFSVFLITYIVWILNRNNEVLNMVTFIQSISLLFISFDSVSYWFQANLQSKYVVVAKSIAFLIISLWRLILIYLSSTVINFAFATTIEAILISLFSVVFYFKNSGDKLRISIDLSLVLLKKSYHFLIAGLLITVYTQVGKIILGQIVNESAVGLYSAGLTISSIWMFIPNALIESARPIILQEKSRNQSNYEKYYLQLSTITIWLSIFASLFISLFSKSIINFVYGVEYIDSRYALIILIWSRIFSIIGLTRSIWLISENKIKYQKYFVGIGAISSLILNLLLIPLFGVIGASIATLVTEIISTFIVLLIFDETKPLFQIIINSFLLKVIKYN